MLQQQPTSPVFPTLPSQQSHFWIGDDKSTRGTIRENALRGAESFASNEHVLNLMAPEPALSQHKKELILDQVEILEEAMVAMIDRRLSRELRDQARQEVQELLDSLEPLGLTFEARLTRGIGLILKRKFPFEETLVLQLAEFVVALRESVERKTAVS
mgnify:CR=1 FL=1